MADNPKRDLRQEITDQIIRALEKGTAPWQKPWQAGALELPFNPVSGKPYRGGNVVQLIAESFNGNKTGYCAFNEKMRDHMVVRDLSSYKRNSPGHGRDEGY